MKFAHKNSTVSGVCLGIPMGDENGYCSNFHTDKEYRIKGIGRKAAFKCLEVLKGRNVYIVSARYMQPAYSRWGFSVPLSQGGLCLDGITKLPTDFRPNSYITIQAINDKNFDDVMAFDQSVCLFNRKDAMRVFFTSPHTLLVKCAVQNDRINGFIMIREGQRGIRMSAFYADDSEIARELLYDAINELGAGRFMDCAFWRYNIDQCMSLYKMFGLQNVVEDFPAYCSKPHVTEFPWQKVYGTIEYFTTLY